MCRPKTESTLAPSLVSLIHLPVLIVHFVFVILLQSFGTFHSSTWVHSGWLAGLMARSLGIASALLATDLVVRRWAWGDEGGVIRTQWPGHN